VRITAERIHWGNEVSLVGPVFCSSNQVCLLLYRHWANSKVSNLREYKVSVEAPYNWIWFLK
jgi:hypothetical protein